MERRERGQERRIKGMMPGYPRRGQEAAEEMQRKPREWNNGRKLLGEINEGVVIVERKTEITDLHKARGKRKDVLLV